MATWDHMWKECRNWGVRVGREELAGGGKVSFERGKGEW